MLNGPWYQPYHDKRYRGKNLESAFVKKPQHHRGLQAPQIPVAVLTFGLHLCLPVSLGMNAGTEIRHSPNPEVI